jgi:hypothetical protein
MIHYASDKPLSTVSCLITIPPPIVGSIKSVGTNPCRTYQKNKTKHHSLLKLTWNHPLCFQHTTRNMNDKSHASCQCTCNISGSSSFLSKCTLVGHKQSYFVCGCSIFGLCQNKVFVGLPILDARYEILKGCLMELVHVSIVWDHHDVFCNFHNIYNMVDETTAWVSPFWNVPKFLRPWVHKAFNHCL